MECIEKYHLIIPYKTKVKLIYGNNKDKEGLVINKTYPRNGNYKTGKYHNYFQLTIQFEDGRKRATSCDYVEIIKEEIKVEKDYKKLWNQLRNEYKGDYAYMLTIQKNRFGDGIQKAYADIIDKMNQLECPPVKKYTWMEILEMNTNSKILKSSCGKRYYRNPTTNQFNQLSDDKELNAWICLMGTYVSPTIEEMKNLWTVED